MVGLANYVCRPAVGQYLLPLENVFSCSQSLPSVCIPVDIQARQLAFQTVVHNHMKTKHQVVGPNFEQKLFLYAFLCHVKLTKSPSYHTTDGLSYMAYFVF